MIWNVRLLFAAALLAAPLCAQPALQPVNETGYQELLAANKGKVVLVNFWATWCQPCRAEMPQLVKMEASLRARGFKLVTVSADEPERGLPRVQVGVDESGDDDVVFEVDNVGAGRIEAVAHRRDALVLDEDVDAFSVGAMRRHGDHLCTAYQYSAHRFSDSRAGRLAIDGALMP